jgi:hypothetical protein
MGEVKTKKCSAGIEKCQNFNSDAVRFWRERVGDTGHQSTKPNDSPISIFEDDTALSPRVIGCCTQELEALESQTRCEVDRCEGASVYCWAGFIDKHLRYESKVACVGITKDVLS